MKCIECGYEDTEPTPDQVEASARAMHAEACSRLKVSVSWEQLQDREQTCFYAYARAALKANP